MSLAEKDKYIEDHLVKLQPGTLRFMVADLHFEAEQLRVQLAGCGVAAKCNTEQSREQQKCVEGDFGWSQSYQDVVNAVGREIKLRGENTMLRGALRYALETLSSNGKDTRDMCFGGLALSELAESMLNVADYNIRKQMIEGGWPTEADEPDKTHREVHF